MADINEINEATDKLNESIRDLGVILESVVQSFAGVADQVDSISGSTTNWNKILDEAVKQIKDLPGGIKSSRDLWQAMTSDAKLFQKVQNQIKNIAEGELSQALEDTSQRLEAANATQVEWNRALTEHAIIEREVNALVQKNLDFAQRLAETQNEINQRSEHFAMKLGNINTLMGKMGDMLRNPGKAIEFALNKLGEMPKKIQESIDKHGGLGKAIKAGLGEGLEKSGQFAKQLFSKGGLLVAGAALATAAVIGLVALFKNFWEFIDKNVLPAMADFNKEIGGSTEATAKLQGQMASMGDRFDRLGMSFQEGAQAVRNVADGLKTVELDPKTLKTGAELASILGLTADEIGNMGLQFQKATGSIEGVNEMMNVGAKEATAYGLPVNTVLKDMAKAPNVLARFGTANAKQFAQATAKAQSYGLSIQEVNQAFGEQLDTFEKTADASAKLNTIFGTQINSMELMLETDPTKRMEMLRKELLAQGKSWDKLNEFEKNVITQNLGVDKSQAALVLSSEEERKKLEAKAKQREREIKINEQWNKGINSLRRTLINWSAELNHTLRNVSRLITTMFGWEKPAKLVSKTSGGLLTMFKDLNKWLVNLRKNWDDTESLDGWGKTIKFVAEGVELFFNLLKLGFGVIGGFLKLIATAVGEFFGLNKAVEEFSLDSVIDFFKDFNDVVDQIEFGTIVDFVGHAFEEAAMAAVGFVSDMWASIKGLWNEGIDFVADALETAKDFWLKPVNAVKEAFVGLVDSAKQSFNSIAEIAKNPFESLTEGFEKMKGFFGFGEKSVDDAIISNTGKIIDLVPKIKSVDDAIITKAGQIIETNPNDNILATQTPVQDLLPKVDAATTTSVNSESMVNELKMLREAITKMSQAKTPATTPTREPSVKVEVVDVNLDGRKVGEAQVRISRF